MAIKMSNVIVSFVIMAFLSQIMFSIVDDFYTGYNLTPSNTVGGKSILESLKDLDFISGIDTFAEGLYKVASPSSPFDILGGLAAAGIGSVKIMVGVITFPIDIFRVLLSFYGMPAYIFRILQAIFVVYVGFVLIKVKTGQET